MIKSYKSKLEEYVADNAKKLLNRLNHEDRKVYKLNKVHDLPELSCRLVWLERANNRYNAFYKQVRLLNELKIITLEDSEFAELKKRLSMKIEEIKTEYKNKFSNAHQAEKKREVEHALKSPLFRISEIDNQLVLNFDESISEYPKIIELMQTDQMKNFYGAQPQPVNISRPTVTFCKHITSLLPTIRVIKQAMRTF
jgi:hypothetical protein